MIGFVKKLSPSERKLAILAGVLLLASIFVVGTLRALDSLASMDETIYGLQQDLLYYKQLTVQAEAVEKAYQAIAAQHSSQWTQEEIHDRLGREIRRLAAKNLPQPGVEVPPAQAGNVLVDIRSMPSGTLEDSGEGYRSYTITFRTEQAPVLSLATFLERLQQSDQALRVDSIDISRQPAINSVTAFMKVTRTVIGAPSAETPVAPPKAPAEVGNLVRNPGFEEWDPQTSTAKEWSGQGCTVTQSQDNVTEGKSSLRVAADQDAAAFYQEQNLVGGSTYEVVLDLQAEAPANITVANGSDGVPLGEGQAARSDSAVYRYRLRFTVPGESGATVSIRAPYIVLSTKTAVVTVDNVSLTRMEDKP